MSFIERGSSTEPGLTFDYAVVGTGWAEATISDSRSSARLTASYLGDALGDLLKATKRLIDGEPHLTCVWEEEPGEYLWEFWRRASNVRIRIVAGMTIFDVHQKGAVLFETTQPMSLVADTFARAAERVLAQHGENGYRELWVEHEFPTATLSAIRTWLTRDKLLSRQAPKDDA